MRTILKSCAVFALLSACVPTDGSMTSSAPQKFASGTVEGDYKTLQALSLSMVQHTLEKRCGAIRAPHIEPDHYSGIGYARRNLNKARSHAQQLPQAKACHEENLFETARLRVIQYSEMADLLDVYAARMSGGQYTDDQNYYRTMKYILSKGAPGMEDLEKEVGVVASRLATADQGAAKALQIANRAMGVSNRKSAAMWSSAISGAIGNGAFSIQGNINAARSAANLPPILTQDQKRQLQATYASAMAQSSDTGSSGSGGSGSSISLTSTHICPGFYDENMTASLCASMEAAEAAKQERLQAEYDAGQAAKAAQNEADSTAIRDARRQAALAADTDHNDCTPPITSPTCHVVSQ